MKMAILEDYKEDVSNLIDRLPNNPRYALLIDRNKSGVEAISDSNIPTNNWQKAFDACGSLEEQNIICKAFLKFKNGTQWKVDYKSQIEPCEDILVRICSEVGFQENSNPFLMYIKNFFKTNSVVKLNRDILIILNNLYAESDIDYDDLARIDKLPIIYNTNLYMQNTYLVSDTEAFIKDFIYIDKNSNTFSFKTKEELAKGIKAETNDNFKKILQNILNNANGFNGDKKLSWCVVAKNGLAKLEEFYPYYSINGIVNKYFKNNSSVDIKGTTTDEDDKEPGATEAKYLKPETVKALDDLINSKALHFKDIKGVMDYLVKKHDERRYK